MDYSACKEGRLESSVPASHRYDCSSPPTYSDLFLEIRWILIVGATASFGLSEAAILFASASSPERIDHKPRLATQRTPGLLSH